MSFVKAFRGFLSGLLLVTLIFPLGSGHTLAVENESGTIVYNFDDGTTQGWGARGAGSVAVTQDSALSAPSSLKHTGRTGTWNGPSLNVKSLLQKGAVYEISADVKLPDKTALPASTVKISLENTPVGGSTGWAQVTTASIANSDWTPLVGNYSFDKDMSALTLYIESSVATESIQIDNVKIKMTTPPPIDQSGLETGFENNTVQAWAPRNGAEVLTVSSSVYHTGSYSLLTEAMGANQGPKINLLGKMQKDSKYNLSVWVRMAPGQSPATLRLSIQRTYQGTNNYETVVGNKEVTADGWVQYTADYTLSNPVDAIGAYVETASAAATFFIDDFKLTYLPGKPIQTNIPSLYQTLNAYFPNGIGAAIEPSQTAGATGDMLKKHFNVIVAENVMKPANLQPSEGTFTFTEADKLIAYAEANGMKVRGHTLAWHSQTGDWMFKDLDGKPMIEETDPAKRAANKALLLSRLETHIKTVVEHFGTKVYAWDVVNEVIDDSNGLRNSPWYQITGEDFIKQAFIWAHQYAPHAKLYINDYNTHNPRKRDDLYNLILRMQAQGVHIDGVGHQTHINVDGPSVREIGDSIEKFGQLGLDNQITELDVSVYTDRNQSYTTVPENVLIKQGYRYKQIFDEFIRLKAYVSSVILWGVGDDHTWLSTFPVTRLEAPLLFDKELQAKYAYWGIVDPSKLPVAIQTIDPAKGTPVIDGNSELVWDVQRSLPFDSGKIKGDFNVLWDDSNLYIKVNVQDATINANDLLELFVDDNNGKTAAYQPDDKHYTLQRNGTAVSGMNYSVKETTDGYRIEASMPITTAVLGSKKGFDLRVTDADQENAQVSWNDVTNSQNTDTTKFAILTLDKALNTQEAIKGTPVIDGEVDTMWANAKEVSTDLWVQGTSGATAKAKIMWDENHLYILANATDSLLSDASSAFHEQDSIEIFLDANNHKSTDYESDDGQFRINFKNSQSFGGAASADKITSAVKLTSDGYQVEAAIQLPNAVKDRMIGFDFQVNNDETGSGSRSSVAIWNDTTGQSYRNTSKFGALQLVDPTAPTEPTVPSNPGSSSVGSTAVPADTIVALDGGKLTLNGTVIEVPAGAAASNFTIKVETISDTSSLFADQPFDAISEVYEITKNQEGTFIKPVVITLPFDKSKVDFSKSKVRIYWFNEETLQWILLEGQQIDQANGTVSASTNHFTKFAVLASAIDAPKEIETALSDIRGHWSEASIRTFMKSGAINGYPDNTFKPDNNITRAEFVTVIVKAFELKAVGEKSFSDTQNHWAQASIATAAALGVVNGKSNDTFAPDDLITREQMAAIIVRAAKLSPAETSSSFTDSSLISDWAHAAVDTAIAKGLLQGYDDNTVRPGANTTRAEAVTIILRALEAAK